MAAPDLVNLAALIDDAKCFALVRQHRWPGGVRCPGCGSDAVVRHGRGDTQPQRQRYRCKACAGRFDDLTGTVPAGHHQPLRIWVLCLYLMGLDLSNRQIVQELGLSGSDAQLMTEQLRHGLAARTPAAALEGEVEIDEVYVVAGHKGRPADVAKGGGSSPRAMYLRTVLRSWPVRRAMVATVSPCRARSRIMTSSPSVTTASSHDAGRHLGGRRAPGSGAGPSRRTEEVSFSASGEHPSSSYTRRSRRRRRPARTRRGR